MTYTNKIVRYLFVLIAFSVQCGYAQLNLSDTLTVDPKVKIGKLQNGLTYYIRQNKKPEQKVELRLVVNTGSIMEDEDQQGLAHLAEHMAFNGTTHFKKNDIISFLQSIGVAFGSDLNAYTSFNETVYILPIPTDKPDNLDKGFQILEDWAHNVTYNDEDIDTERPIVLEESRLGKGANDRMYRKLYPKIFAGSLYGRRLPIGIDSILRNAKYETLRKFYKDWYRPNLMAVIVVGDIEPVKAEELITKYFSGLTNPENERPRTIPEVLPYDSSEAMVVTDKEATTYRLLDIYSSVPKTPTATIGDYRNDIIKNIFSTLLNQRLRELTQKENPPFINASADFDSYSRGYETFNGDISIGNGDPERALQAFAEEVERVKKYGFTQPELDRVKRSLLTAMEQAYNEKDKTESPNYVREYIRNFLVREPSPGIEKEYEYYQQLIPQITLDEVNAVAKSLNKNNNRFIALTGPDPSAGKALPTVEELLAKADAVEKMNITPYEEKATATSLLAMLPKSGKIISSKKNVYLGTTELKLSNGVTVTIKPTDFKNDQVLMSAIRPGGKNNYTLEDKYNAEYATAIVTNMGVGEFSPVDLRKVLAGKTASVTPVFTATSEGVSGNSSLKDMETMLQLMYLYFTSPRKDTSLFKSFIQKSKSQVAMLSANPQAAFVDTFFKTVYHNDPLAPVYVPSSENYDKVNLDRALEIYKERFGNANGMYFTFVGSFKEEDLKPLIERYIASLPSNLKKYTYAADNKLRPVNGKVNLNFNKGKEQKSLILAMYSGEVPYSEDLELKSEAITEILNIRIIEELREKIQGIYGGGIYAQFEKIPYPHYAFFLQLPSGPEKVDTLLVAANKEIENLKTNGPSLENLNKVKQQWREEYKTKIKENNTWLNALQSFKFPGDEPKRFIEYEKYINALTVKDVQDAAKLLLNGANVVTAVLRPESSSASADVSKRKTDVVQTIELTSPDFTVDLYDNADIDGDSVTVYFNGNVVAAKQKLTDKAISLKLKALPQKDNELIMYAENLGTIPPNTALMKVNANGKSYEVRISSDEKKNGTVIFKLK
jgi:zinc protease